MNLLSPQNKSLILFFLFAGIAIIASFFLLVIAITFFPITIGIFIIVKYTPIRHTFTKVYHKIYDYLFYQSEKPRKLLWGFIYDFMCAYFPLNKWRAMNYGYALLNENGRILNNLDEQQEEERFCIQLYHMVATNCLKLKDLQGKRVLEVGSGRGGGLYYIHQSLKPEYCVGVDYSQNQVDFCKTTYRENQKLNYLQGDAENLTNLNIQTFDLIINVESSHCYGNFQKFVQEVTKLLNTGGLFIITDFRAIEELKQFEQDLQSTGLKLETKEDITINVLQALKLDEKRKQQWMNRHCGIIFRSFFNKFSGVQSSRIFQELSERKTLYLIYALRKV
ncbi:unnamed protein product [Paramecium primaurelia]|uniref:Methyltransferase domain-containing protein n=2 Tax=Paramecium TaxID=5884 RepID=A0A8S1UV52_9CILI|nr:unnamed protein product [Paramecium primaurelia]CAD8166326.1 unnamed protein product [Paramecium pentaurelia]